MTSAEELLLLLILIQKRSRPQRPREERDAAFFDPRVHDSDSLTCVRKRVTRCTCSTHETHYLNAPFFSLSKARAHTNSSTAKMNVTMSSSTGQIVIVLEFFLIILLLKNNYSSPYPS